MAPEPWLRVARIVRPQGHRGEVIADLLTDFPARFGGRPLLHLRSAGSAEATRSAVVESYRLHGGRVVLKFEGCCSIPDAEALRDMDVVVPWDARAPLGDDEVYIADLVGCTLVDTSAGEPVGTVVDVDRESSHHALLVVAATGGRELLVPFVKAYAPSWDLPTRTLRMQLPGGLLDLTG